MTDHTWKFRDDRRRTLKLLGGAVGGLMLGPYGCSRDSGEPPKTRFEAPPLANGYRFIRIVTLGDSGFEGMRGITPGVMLNEKGEVIFYAPIDGENAYALFRLQLDFSKETPAIGPRTSVVRTGQQLAGGQQVRRILIADTNARGHTAFIVDGFARNNGENVVEQAPTLYVQDTDRRNERILGLGDPAPDGATFGASLGDVDITDQNHIFIVSAFTTGPRLSTGRAITFDTRDVEEGVFYLPEARLGEARTLLQSGQALRGTGAVNQSFGLIDARDEGHFLLQTRIQDAGMMQTTPGVASGVLYQGNATAPPGAGRMLTGAPLLGADQAGPAELLLGPRAGISATGAWVEHYGEATDDRDQPQVLYYSDGKEVHRIAETGKGITAFSAPVLSGNGQMFYMQINDEDNPGMELRVTDGADTRTILARGQEIDGKEVTALLHGYHSEQADSHGRVVVYAELDDEPALLLGFPV